MMCFSDPFDRIRGFCFYIHDLFGVEDFFGRWYYCHNAIDHSDFYPFDGRDCPGIAAGYAECFLFPGATRYETIKVVGPADRSGYRIISYFVVYRRRSEMLLRCCSLPGIRIISRLPWTAGSHLPLAVFFQLSSPIPAVQERAYAAALILTIIVLILSILGRIITNRFSRNKIQ